MSSTVRRAFNESSVIARKELTELRRQPGVLLLVVLGPFVVLAMFGIGYRNEELALKTVFVGPSSTPYEAAIDRYAAAIDQYVVPVAYTTDLAAAGEDLSAGRVDLIVVLPPRVEQAVLAGERSEIAFIHNSIDPIERIGIDFAAEVAVRELNASVVTATLDSLLNEASDVSQVSGQLTPQFASFEQAIAEGDERAATLAVLEIQQTLDDMRPAFELSIASVPAQSESEDATTISALDELSRRLNEADGDTSQVELEPIRTAVAELDRQLAQVLSLDAELLARPFVGDAESLVRSPVSAEDHVAPGATALLVQHLSVSLAALSLVRDERRGIMAGYRVGPTSVSSVLAGKLAALSAVGLVAALLLVGLQVLVLDVPLRGSLAAAMGIIIGLVVASVALGLLLASVFRTELFASQSAMIALLVALFFSGFLLDLDRIIEPIRSFGALVPATPAVTGLRNVQLRGSAAGTSTAVTLTLQTLGALAIAGAVLARRWRSGLR